MSQAEHHFEARFYAGRGLTLVELLVTLILGVLVLSMILPLLHQLLSHHPGALDSKLASAGDVPWKRALEADLQELVSPAKCGIPVFQLLPASDTQPYAELVLQTFCRASGSDINSISRGPSEVRYCLETDAAAGPLVLVRYAKGWHDSAAARHILADQVSGWTVDFHGIAPVAAQASASAGTALPVRPGELVIDESSPGGTIQSRFWVPLLEAPPPLTKDHDQTHQDPKNSPLQQDEEG